MGLQSLQMFLFTTTISLLSNGKQHNNTIAEVTVMKNTNTTFIADVIDETTETNTIAEVTVMNTIKNQIKTNNEKISKKAFIPHLRLAAELTHGRIIEGDLRLDRMAAAISVIYHSFDANEGLADLQRKCIQLNVLRSTYGYKPDFMDTAVRELEEELFYLAVAAGLGDYQLAELSCLFKDKISELDLDYLHDLEPVA